MFSAQPVFVGEILSFMMMFIYCVAAQEGPGIVIAHPGQNVELLCTVTVTSANKGAAWMINGKGPYVVNSIRDGSITGYTTTLDSNNLIVENIMMNDDRNDTELQCVIITIADNAEQRRSDPFILYVTVATQKIPRIVIAHPSQDVELLCTVTMTLGNPTVSWMINDMTPIGLGTLHEGRLAGYTSNGNNLIIENVTMNDVRNGSNYNCMITSRIAVLRQSNPTTLYIAGVPAMVPGVTVDGNTININRNSITMTLSWGEPFNNLNPIVTYTVSCSGDVTCPPNFTTTDNTARSYTITNLTPMTTYTFSVVATNSIGSGEAGVVMITTPAIFITTTSSMNMCTIASSIDMTTTATRSKNTGSSCGAIVIGAVVGVDSVVIIIIVITNIMIWIYCFRKRYHTAMETSVGGKLELHGPTKDTINPTYHTITDRHIKRSTEEPISYYEEVKKTPDPDVKVTPNPAYAVP